MLRGIDFSKVPKREQEAFFEASRNIPWRNLTIKNSSVFNEKIPATLDMLNLTRLNLSGCTELHWNRMIHYLAKSCPCLSYLDVSNIDTLFSMWFRVDSFFDMLAGKRLQFPSLRHLKVNQCRNLDHLSIDAEQLLTLEARQCPKLGVLFVSPNLRLLDVRGSTWIHDKMLDELIEANSNLRMLYVQGCPKVSEPKHRELYPRATLKSLPRSLTQAQAYADAVALLKKEEQQSTCSRKKCDKNRKSKDESDRNFCGRSSNDQDTFYAGLALEAGGMRGLMQAVVLQQLEKETRIPVYRLFDCIGGASSGGLIALGFTACENGVHPFFTADRIVKLFYEKGRDIFSSPIECVEEPFYRVENYERTIKSYFQENRLSDALTGIVIPVMIPESPEEHFVFDSENALRGACDDYLMCDVARACWADPEYFEAAAVKVKNLQNVNSHVMIDANSYRPNPAKLVYDRLRKMDNANETNIRILSLGVGALPRNLGARAAQTSAVHHDLLEKFGEFHYRYYHRLQPRLEQPFELDETNPEILDYAIGIAEKLLEGEEVFVRELAENSDRKD